MNWKKTSAKLQTTSWKAYVKRTVAFGVAAFPEEVLLGICWSTAQQSTETSRVSAPTIKILRMSVTTF